MFCCLQWCWWFCVENPCRNKHEDTTQSLAKGSKAQRNKHDFFNYSNLHIKILWHRSSKQNTLNTSFCNSKVKHVNTVCNIIVCFVFLFLQWFPKTVFNNHICYLQWLWWFFVEDPCTQNINIKQHVQQKVLTNNTTNMIPATTR